MYKNKQYKTKGRAQQTALLLDSNLKLWDNRKNTKEVGINVLNYT